MSEETDKSKERLPEAPKKPRELHFEKEYQLGLLPTVHITKDGPISFIEMHDSHLYAAWRWFAENAHGSPTYMALQREKQRRDLGLPEPETHPPQKTYDVTCPDCGAPMKLRGSKYGLFYGCTTYPACKAAHGAHPDGRPLGKPATKFVKGKRIQAHEAFDKLWEGTRMKRKDAYRWMQEAMGMTKEEAHIGNYDAEQCERLIAKVNEYLNTLEKKP
jgi:ssDNA-binding Zn-finger/Zn-ribbon topoisomerase 1